jgi:hypothetical protein
VHTHYLSHAEDFFNFTRPLQLLLSVSECFHSPAINETSQNSSPRSFVSFGLFSHLRSWRMSLTSIKLQSVYSTSSVRHTCSRQATKGRSFRYFTLICDKGFQPAYAPSIRHIILNLISTSAARNQGYGEVLPRISVSHIEKRCTASSQPARKAV